MAGWLCGRYVCVGCLDRIRVLSGFSWSSGRRKFWPVAQSLVAWRVTSGLDYQPAGMDCGLVYVTRNRAGDYAKLIFKEVLLVVS